MHLLVCGGMYRARGASLRTIETVVTEKPLSLATSRMVTADPLALFKRKLLTADTLFYCRRRCNSPNWNQCPPFAGAPTWGIQRTREAEVRHRAVYTLRDGPSRRSFPQRAISLNRFST